MKTAASSLSGQTIKLGRIFQIQRFSIQDGPGIRTTVFLKGCPLCCLWCHNPESVQAGQEVFFSASQCMGCGYCFEHCAQHAHRMVDGVHVLDREACVACGECGKGCYTGALEMVGYEASVEEVLAEVLKDRPFYETSGGGMTLSGGEPLTQFEFSRALLAAARESGLHTCVETSGFAPFEHLLALLPLVDLFYIDCKETDPARHQDYTGVTLARIVENFTRLDALGVVTVLRCPIVPGLNARDDHFLGIAALANRLHHVKEVHILPYHPLGRSKLERLGKPDVNPEWSFPERAVVESWIAAVARDCHVPVLQG